MVVTPDCVELSPPSVVVLLAVVEAERLNVTVHYGNLMTSRKALRNPRCRHLHTLRCSDPPRLLNAMSWLFKPRKSPADLLRENKRSLDKGAPPPARDWHGGVVACHARICPAAVAWAPRAWLER